MADFFSPLADEKDAYTRWLRSEFAAANAIIDNLCLHILSIGNLGEYDAAFDHLNQRRQAWGPSLHMQEYVSIAEVVKSLQEVAQSRNLQVCCQFKAPHGQYTADCHHRPAESQVCGTKAHICKQQENSLQCHSSKNVVELAISPKEAGNGRLPPWSLIKTSPSPAECSAPSCDFRTASKEVEATSSTIFEQNAEQKTSIEHTSLLDCEAPSIDRLFEAEVIYAPNGGNDRYARIKNSMLFQCCERVDGKMVNDGESGVLYENVFSDKEVDELVEMISRLQVEGRQGSLGRAFCGYEKSEHKPDTIQFGPNSNEGAELSKGTHLLMPRFLQAMIKWLVSCDILPAEKTPDSCLISIFNEDHFATPSTDQGAWERPVCVVSLSENTNMVFGHYIASHEQGHFKGPFEVILPAGSVLLLEENFSGILQKAVPASPTKRIILTLGKASRSSTLGLTNKIAAEKTRWGIGAQNLCYPGMFRQEMLEEAISMHQPCHVIPGSINGPLLQPFFPFPDSIHPGNPYDCIFPQEWPHFPSHPQRNSSIGTGVFWPSGLLMPVSAGGLMVRRPRNRKRSEQHLKVKGTFDPATVLHKEKQDIISPLIPNGSISTST